jgi:Mor family transcriptional regulator
MIPLPGPDPLSYCGPSFRQLWRDTCKEFGRESGRAIMNKVIVYLGGLRPTFPNREDVYRAERNRKICTLYNGRNHGELALRFKLTTGQIITIVNDDDNY